MADDRDFERTEPASQRRLEEARAHGQVARSPELSTFAILTAAVLSITLLGAGLSQALRDLFVQTMVIDRSLIYAPGAMTAIFASVGLNTVFALLPLSLMILVVLIGSAFLLGGWTFAPGTLAIDADRINPLSGARRAFSVESLYRLFKYLLKAALFGAALFAVLWLHAYTLPGLVADTSASAMVRWLTFNLLMIVGLLGVVAVIDAAFAVWKYRRGLRMTRAELLQEHRESEGAPEPKARLRQALAVQRVRGQETL